MKTIIAMFTAFAAMILPATAHAQFAQPGTFAQPGGTTYNQPTTVPGPTNGGAQPVQQQWNNVNGVPVNQNGIYQQGNDFYQPQQTVNINNSGCPRNLLNALACIVTQGVVQAGVNRSAVREQRDATIVVDRARFTLGQGGGEAYGSPAPAGPAMVQCTLNVGGQTQTIRVTEADCQRAAADYGTTAQRR